MEPFLPSNAYVMIGHGSEPLHKTFIVPNNCIVISKARPDERLYFPSVFKNVESINQLDPTILANPIPNMRKIVKKIGPVTVYGPGETCPNFRYYFDIDLKNISGVLHDFIVERKLNPRMGWLLLTRGLISLPYSVHKLKQISRFFPNVKNENMILLKTLVDYMYYDSLYPLTHIVHQKMEEILGAERYQTCTIQDITEDDITRLHNQFTITQEDLCNKFSGVFYNFVCRRMTIKMRSFDYWVNGKAHPSIYNVTSNPKNISTVIKRVIGNSLKRKGTVKLLYNNNSRNRNKNNTKKNKRAH